MANWALHRTTARPGVSGMADILEGNLTLDHKPLTSSIRLFISSDFADSQWERQYLRESVLPDLKEYCQFLGLQLHAVDLYHDIQAAEPYRAMYELEMSDVLQHALQEIRLCQRLSGGPSFVTLLAQRYGHTPLRRHIPESEFGLLCAAIEDQAAKLLVQQCYRLSTNAVPPEYVLQPLQYSSIDQLETLHNSLSKAIRKAARVALGKDPAKVNYYTMSVTEEEVSVGIFNVKGNPNECCFWFKRTFTDLLEQKPNDVALPAFADLTAGRRGLEFDLESVKALNHFKETRLPASYVGLDSANIFEFPVKWQKNRGLDPQNNPAHSNYLSEVCVKFDCALKEKIAYLADCVQAQEENALYQEVLCHGSYCKDKVKNFEDVRKSVTSAILSYLRSPSNTPLVVHGVSGSGKTSIVAAAAYELRKTSPASTLTIVLRFLGTTEQSSSIFHTLRTICQQISSIYKEHPSSVPGDYKGIAEHFKVLLHQATVEKPLFVFLDAVDQLSPEDGALGLSWLPLYLPPHVKIVVSTSSEVQYHCFPVLQSVLSNHPENFIEVPPLSQMESRALLKSRLASLNRKLTTAQKQVVLEKLSLCPLPLCLTLLMRKIESWTSYMEVTLKDLFSKTDIRGILVQLFDDLEKDHGKVLVSHVTAYITASRHGLAETELLDILSCDDEVLKELMCSGNWSQNPLRTVPPIVWSKLRQSLHPLLEFRIGVGGALVLRWSHRLVEEVVMTKYLDGSDRVKTFSMLADYFSGKQAQERQNEQICTAQRGSSPLPPINVNKHPLLLSNGRYNTRKLTELPYCLAKCNRYAELEGLLLSFPWVKACVHATSCADLITDISRVVPLVPLGRHGVADDFPELRLLREALVYSLEALSLDPSQLATQLLGRLLPFLRERSGEFNSHLRDLVVNALDDAKPKFTPLQPLLHLPGNPLLATMQGHRDRVSAIATTMVKVQNGVGYQLCIVSCSWDNSLKSWDLGSTGVLKTFDGHTDKVLSVTLSADGQYAISGSADATVRQWYVPTGQCLRAMEGHSAAVNAVAVTTDGVKAVSGSSDTTIQIWNSDSQSESAGRLIYTVRSHRSPVRALALYGDKYLASGAEDGNVLVTNVVSGEDLVCFQGDSMGISAMAVTHLQSTTFLCTGSSNGTTKVWDMLSGKLLHVLVQKDSKVVESPVRSITAGPKGKALTTYDKGVISVWDLSNGTHMYDLPSHSDVCCSSVADAGSLAITGAADCTISIWDLENPPLSKSIDHHDGAVTSVAISPCETYGASAGEDAIVRVYELQSMTTVKELKGHTDRINQLLVLRDTQTVVTASLDKTIKVWDAQAGVLMQSLEGHNAAVNCIAATMGGDLLMSGAEDGDVIFWSLKTGKKLKTFSNHSSPVVMVGFTKNTAANCIVSASKDGNICVREFYSAKTTLNLSTHANLLCVTISPDSIFLATGSEDTTACIYTLTDGSLQATLVDHIQAVTCIKFLADCSTVLTSSLDKSLRIWDVHSATCLSCLYVDAPILACDISRKMTVLYGAANGWLSTALYHCDPTTPSTLLGKLQAGY